METYAFHIVKYTLFTYRKSKLILMTTKIKTHKTNFHKNTRKHPYGLIAFIDATNGEH